MESQYSLRKTQKDARHSASPTGRDSLSPTNTLNSVRSTLHDENNLEDASENSSGSGGGEFVSVASSNNFSREAAGDASSTSSQSRTTSVIVPSANGSFDRNVMAVIEEKAARLLREGHINEEEHALILSNHLSAMNRTTSVAAPSDHPAPPPPLHKTNAAPSSTENPRHGSRVSRRRIIAEQHAMSTLTKAEAQKQKESKKRHQQIAQNMETWRNRILPRWEECKASAEVSRLVQKGIPTSLRGEIWCRMLSNKLQISPDVFHDHLEEALKMYDANGRLSLLARPDDDGDNDCDGDGGEKEATGGGEGRSRERQGVAQQGVVEKVTGDSLGVDEAGLKEQDQGREDDGEHGGKDDDNNCRGEDELAAGGEGHDCSTQSGGSSLTASSIICQVVSGSRDEVPGDSFTEAPIRHDRNSVGASEKLELLVASMTLIQRDIPRTFPTLSFFHDDGPLASSLDHVLKAYACYEPTIGYVQGMSYIAALLLLYMDEYDTFVCFSNLLAIRTNRDFYLLEHSAIAGYVKTFNRFFKQYLPLLCDHFEDEGITNTIFLLDWHLTLFTKALPLEIAARIWDCYLHSGEVYILRASLGLLRLFARRLSSLSMEKILPFLAHVPEDELSASELIHSIEQIRISPEKYRSVRIQFDGSLQRDSVNMGAAVAGDTKSSPNFSFRKSIANMFS